MIIMSKTTQVIQYRYGQINFCKAKKKTIVEKVHKPRRLEEEHSQK